jgi:lipopolysaccharide transport system permease protein
VTDFGQSLRREGDFPEAIELRRIGELVLCLSGRDLRVRYKQSALGVLWAVVQPVSLMAVFVLVLGPSLGSSLPGGEPYALFVLAGLVPWSFFSASLVQSANCLVANRNLVTKVYFPREAFPFSCVATALVDFGVGLAALGALIVYYAAGGQWAFVAGPGLLFLPAIVLVQVLLSAGLGLWLAMGHLFHRDVRPVLTVALNLGMFVSAVVVPVPAGPGFVAAIVAANPMVHILAAYRDGLLHGRLPEWAGFGFAAITSVAVFITGWLAFRRASGRFAECI